MVLIRIGLEVIGIVVIGMSRDFLDDLVLMQHLHMSVHHGAVALSGMGGEFIHRTVGGVGRIVLWPVDGSEIGIGRRSFRHMNDF